MDEKQNKETLLQVRLTAEEKRQLAADAKAEGLKISQYVMLAIKNYREMKELEARNE